mmetsp:Transcript_337/g.498  ORF Transcript_337/g.498 Transcript_337/m.498 type:complete len:618 (-) Transcript_337:772-2625(-)
MAKKKRSSSTTNDIAGPNSNGNAAGATGLRIGDLANTEAISWQNPERDSSLRARGFFRINTIITRGVTPENKRNKPKEFKISLILERLCYENACTRQDYEDMRSFKVLMHRMAAEKAKRRSKTSRNEFRFKLLGQEEISPPQTMQHSIQGMSTAYPPNMFQQASARGQASLGSASFAVPNGNSFLSTMHVGSPSSGLPQHSMYSVDSDRADFVDGDVHRPSHRADDELSGAGSFASFCAKQEDYPNEDLTSFGGIHTNSKPPTPILPQREQSVGSESSDHGTARKHPRIESSYSGGYGDDISGQHQYRSSKTPIHSSSSLLPRRAGLRSAAPFPPMESESSFNMHFGSGQAHIMPSAPSSHSMLSPTSPVPTSFNGISVEFSPMNEEPDQNQVNRSGFVRHINANMSRSTSLSSNSHSSSGHVSSVDNYKFDKQKQLQQQNSQLHQFSMQHLAQPSLLTSTNMAITTNSLHEDYVSRHNNNNLNSGGSTIRNSNSKHRSHSDSNLPAFNPNQNSSGNASIDEMPSSQAFFETIGEHSIDASNGVESSCFSRYNSIKDGDRYLRQRTPRRRQSVAGTRFFNDNEGIDRTDTSPHPTVSVAKVSWAQQQQQQRCFATSE